MQLSYCIIIKPVLLFCKPPVRLPLPYHLRREEHIIESEEDVTGSKKIGEEITEVLEYTSGRFHVVRYFRPKYALPNEGGIVIGELPSLPEGFNLLGNMYQKALIH